MELQPHQQRMMQEWAELDEKYRKLYDFIHGDRFHVLCDEAERERMIRQLNGMFLYKEALAERIAAFGG